MESFNSATAKTLFLLLSRGPRYLKSLYCTFIRSKSHVGKCTSPVNVGATVLFML